MGDVRNAVREIGETSGPLRVLMGAAAVAVILATLHAAQDLVIVVAAAVLITVVAAPYESRLIARGWSRLVALSAVIAVTVVGIVAVVLAVEVSLTGFIADLPAYEPGSEELLRDVLYMGSRVGLDLTHVVDATAAITKAFSTADALTRSLLTSLAGWTVVLVLTVFMLHEALDFPAKLRTLVPDTLQRQRLADFAAGLSRYTRVMTVGATLTAVGDLVVMLVLGVPSAVLWAGLAFLFSYIPSVGYIMIVIPPTVVTLVRFGFGRALLVLVVLTVIDNIAGVIIVPRLIGERVDVAPFWGMLSLVIWGWLFGPLGAVLAVPFTMFVKYLLESSPSTAPIGRLIAPLGRRPAT